MNKEEREIRKLELEIKELERPWFVRPANLLSIISLAFAVYQYQSAELKKAVANTLAIQTEKEAEYLEDKSQKVREAEKRLVNKNLAPIESTGRIMDVWAFGVDDAIVQEIKKYLQMQGNEVGLGGLLSYRPNWLALKSTVFYYDKHSKSTAQKIAQELTKKTGIDFSIRWGAGLGVDKHLKDKTFFIHVVE